MECSTRGCYRKAVGSGTTCEHHTLRADPPDRHAQPPRLNWPETHGKRPSIDWLSVAGRIAQSPNALQLLTLALSMLSMGLSLAFGFVVLSKEG